MTVISDSSDYSIVIPFYSGYETIVSLVKGLSAVGDFKIIVVNDSGEEPDLLESILEHEQVAILHLNGNYGQHFATIAGILNTDRKHVITMDEDLQHRPQDVEMLIQKHRESSAEVIYADRTRPAAKRIIHRILAEVFFKNAPKTTCSFRLIDKKIAHQFQIAAKGFYQVEGIIMSLNPQYSYVAIEDSPSERTSGSAYSLVGVFGLVSSLVAFYSPFPWVALNLILFIGALFFGIMGSWVAVICSIPLALFSFAVLGNHIFALNQNYPKFEDLTFRNNPKIHHRK